MSIPAHDTLPTIAATVRGESLFTAAELTSRRGHAVAFLGPDVPLPRPSGHDVWVRYKHFSITLDRQRRQPRLIIVDIDAHAGLRLRRHPDPDPRHDADRGRHRGEQEMTRRREDEARLMEAGLATGVT